VIAAGGQGSGSDELSMGDIALIATAIATAVVATAAFVSKRWSEMREFASRVHLDPDRHDNELTVVVKNNADGPIQYAGCALFSYGRRRWFWRWRETQDDWWDGERIVGRYVPMIGPHGESEPVTFTMDPRRISRDHIHPYPPVILEFTDCAGTRWVRWPDGKLSWRPKKKFRLEEYEKAVSAKAKQN
jgi:hypothetical protein